MNELFENDIVLVEEDSANFKNVSGYDYGGSYGGSYGGGNSGGGLLSGLNLNSLLTGGLGVYSEINKKKQAEEAAKIAQAQAERARAEAAAAAAAAKAAGTKSADIKAYGLPIAIGGGMIVLGIAAYFFFKKKKID
jgi:hypothetical protein